jgi:hypothetical protein
VIGGCFLLLTFIVCFHFFAVALKLQGLMMVSVHRPDDSEFDFRTAMNIWGKFRKRHTGIFIEKAKKSTENSFHFFAVALKYA